MACLFSCYVILAILAQIQSAQNIIVRNYETQSTIWWLGFYLDNVDVSCGVITNVEVKDHNNIQQWISYTAYYPPIEYQIHITNDITLTLPISVRITTTNDVLIATDIITTFAVNTQFNVGSNFCITTTKNPTPKPTKKPSSDPTKRPSSNPTKKPIKPSSEPTNKPSSDPTKTPSSNPTKKASSDPTKRPSLTPTSSPTKKPSSEPTNKPSLRPTQASSTFTTKNPFIFPTSNAPTFIPTEKSTVLQIQVSQRQSATIVNTFTTPEQRAPDKDKNIKYAFLHNINTTFLIITGTVMLVLVSCLCITCLVLLKYQRNINQLKDNKGIEVAEIQKAPILRIQPNGDAKQPPDVNRQQSNQSQYVIGERNMTLTNSNMTLNNSDMHSIHPLSVQEGYVHHVAITPMIEEEESSFSSSSGSSGLYEVIYEEHHAVYDTSKEQASAGLYGPEDEANASATASGRGSKHIVVLPPQTLPPPI